MTLTLALLKALVRQLGSAMLCLITFPILAQTPTTLNFIVIGKSYVEAHVGVNTHCSFWSLQPPNPWRVEVACYDGLNKTIASLYVMMPGKMLNDTYHSDDGSVSWQITSITTSALVSYSIAIGLPGVGGEKLRIDSF